MHYGPYVVSTPIDEVLNTICMENNRMKAGESVRRWCNGNHVDGEKICHTHTHVLLTAPADGRVGCSHTLRHGYPQISPHTPTHTLTCVSHSNRPCGNLQPLLSHTHLHTETDTCMSKGWSYRSHGMFFNAVLTFLYCNDKTLSKYILLF